ncbi:MAG: ergothioneine biosynthesis protein EgtB [Candidatus Sericytochromatia bacterium]|nr:ergothioneine biosynthesis protein EgtB [Candidatus Sericytochromatia bacterium]
MDEIATKFSRIRALTEEICKPLIHEDYVIQSIPEVSPVKWHIAHITWFFENFILIPHYKNYKIFDINYNFIFNSYYNSVGKMLDKNKRSILSRPSVEEIYKYRKYVNDLILELIKNADQQTKSIVLPLLEIGLNHEQQHQELLLMDIKNNFYHNPLKPVYIDNELEISLCEKLSWVDIPEQVIRIGHQNLDFSFDNELPVHKSYINGCTIASRPVLNGEFVDFINSGGYDDPRYWLSDGWSCKNNESWKAPLYWEKDQNNWSIFTLNGLKKLDEYQPVCHISYYEADAFATWSGKRLPSEFEWEAVAKDLKIEGNFLDNKKYQPHVDTFDKSAIQQMYGDVWEWTSSAYLAYPGFKALYEGLGEYNGKFMINQMVLRGGCCVTPKEHIRLTYRNFFYPQNRWQFSGMRLVNDD